MRNFALLVTVSAALFITSTAASAATTASQSRMATCAAGWKAMSADQKKATTYKDYSKSCLSGGANATAAAPAPAAPTAATPAASSGPQGRMATCAAGWRAMSADQKKATTYKDYSKSCLSGGSTAAAATPTMAPTTMKPAKPMATSTMGAATGAAPAGATGQCKDGTFTMSKTHSGSCSHHGGVAKWF